MGRPSKLSEAQWSEVERRMLEGESIRSLAKEFKINESAIRARKSAPVEEIKTVVNQLVSAERAVKALPISAQVIARSRALMLQSIEDNVLTGAANGAATFVRLTHMANTELQKVNDADLLSEGGAERLRVIAGLGKMANEAIEPAKMILNANKERIQQMADEAEIIEAEPLDVKSLPVLDAAKAYQDFVSGQ